MEREARQTNLAAEQVQEHRLQNAISIINQIGKWIYEEIKNTLPTSEIGKAMAYAYVRWDALSAYLYDGNLQIANNLVENAIQPVALGRKTIYSPKAMKPPSVQRGSTPPSLYEINTTSTHSCG